MGGSQWPVGSVTLLFTDIEGSTRLIEELGEDGYVQALAEHRRLLREAFSLHRGVEVDTQGDAFLYAFADAGEAFAAASDGQEVLATTAVRVRMGLHTGELRLTGEGYAGRELHRAARIAAAGHGGQVVVSATTRSLVDGELTELGEHRLKDFPQPVALFQVGRERFPPLKTISNTNLPRPVSSFVGREREREELVSMLADGTRLVTLSGPGGSGKTRLAVEAATELVPEFTAGVFWVGLSALRDPALVTETIAQVLGAKEGLAEHIGERELLLVPDNFEQVVDAAPELAALLEACPNLKLLVTSRELLRIRGEVEYAVPPLAEPEGLQLFCERSRLEPDERIAELCRRLDELPLALELAAARTSVLSPAQILERLSQRLDLLKGGRDVEARQQTLRATIEWSHDLLGEDERRLFARLAVFQGGCRLEAAEHVCDAELDVLESLVDKSLVRVREGDRFWMLETIRAYALERIEASGEAESLRARHAEQILALCVEAEPEILGVAPKPALDRLDRELENIRGALDWLEESGRFEEAMQIGGATWEFWCLRNRWGEGWRRLERLLETEAGSPSLRAGVLLGSAHLAPAAGPAGEALQRQRAEESLALQRELGDPWGIAFAEFQLATAHFEEGDFAGALPLCEQSVERMREIGDEHRAFQALEGLTMCCRQTGDLERANALAQQLRDEARAAGDGFMESAGLLYLSLGARDEERFADALALLNECHRFVREFGSTIVVGLNLLAFASTLAKAEDHEAAARILGCAEARRREAGTNFSGYMARELLDPTDESARSALGVETFAAAWKQGLLLTADEAVELALRTPYATSGS